MTTANTAPWLLVTASIAATYVWRGAGVYCATRIDPQGRLFAWVSCVSYALLAGLIARMIVLPVGALNSTPLIDRLLAVGLSFAVYYLVRRRPLPAVLAGVGVFILISAMRAAVG